MDSAYIYIGTSPKTPFTSELLVDRVFLESQYSCRSKHTTMSCMEFA